MGQQDIARDQAEARDLWQKGILSLDVAGRRIEPREDLTATCPHCGATIPPIEPGFRVMAQAYRRCTVDRHTILPRIDWGSPFYGIPAIEELYHCRACGEPFAYLFQMRLPPVEG